MKIRATARSDNLVSATASIPNDRSKQRVAFDCGHGQPFLHGSNRAGFLFVCGKKGAVHSMCKALFEPHIDGITELETCRSPVQVTQRVSKAVRLADMVAAVLHFRLTSEPAHPQLSAHFECIRRIGIYAGTSKRRFFVWHSKDRSTVYVASFKELPLVISDLT